MRPKTRRVVLADIGIPRGVYDALDVPPESPVGAGYRVELDSR